MAIDFQLKQLKDIKFNLWFKSYKTCFTPKLISNEN
jgi:hypothetical protein